MSHRTMVVRRAGVCALVVLGALVTAITASGAPRIIGGRPATPVDPAATSTVALIDPSAPTPLAGFFCGGTLVAPQLVLTARHCVDEPPFLTPPRQIDVVRSDDLHLATTASTTMARSRVASIHRTRGTFAAAQQSGADIALLRLEQPLTGATVLPIAHHGDEAWWGGGAARPTGVFGLGWGATVDANGRTGAAASGYQAALQLAEFPVVGTDTCAANAEMPEVTRHYVCAGSITRNGGAPAASCYGDSGGPLVATDPTGVDPAARKLVGVVSYGEAEVCSADYGRYVRVSDFADWIDAFAAVPSGAPSGVVAPRLVASRLVGTKTRLTLASEGAVPPVGALVVVRTAYDAGLESARPVLTPGGQTNALVGLPPTKSGRIALTLHGLDASGDESAPGDRVLVTTVRDRLAPTIQRVAAASLGGGRWRVTAVGLKDADRVSGLYVEQRRRGAKRWSLLGVQDCDSCWTGGAGARPVIAAYGLGAGMWQFRVTPLDRAGNVGTAVVSS